MSEPAKDEAELVQSMAKAMHNVVYEGQSQWDSIGRIEQFYREMEAYAALDAIRAAGWEVAPQTELDTLRAENARMREALEEMARDDFDRPFTPSIKAAMQKCAREALEMKP